MNQEENSWSFLWQNQPDFNPFRNRDCIALLRHDSIVRNEILQQYIKAKCKLNGIKLNNILSIRAIDPESKFLRVLVF